MKENSFFDDTQPRMITKNQALVEMKEKQDKLFSDLLNTQFDVAEWLRLFFEYTVKYNRFIYSNLSAKIICEESDETVSNVIQNIDAAIGHLSEDSSLSEEKFCPACIVFSQDVISVPKKQYQMLIKFYDHCNLASIQREAYKQTRKDISEITSNSFETKFRNYEKDISAQLISLIAIFTALAFIAFGGISILDNLLTNIKILSLFKLLIVGALWFLCMVNLFHMFAKFICSITYREFKFKILWINILTAIVLLTLIILHVFCHQYYYTAI